MPTSDRTELAARFLRLGLGLLLSLLEWGFSAATAGVASLDPRSAFAFACGLFLGWQGVLGFALAGFVRHFLLHGSPAPWPLPIADALVGVVAWASFRYLARQTRRRPDLRSFAVFLGSAIVVGLPAATLINLAVFGTVSWPAIGFWWTTLVTSIILLVPIVGLVCLPNVDRLQDSLDLAVLPLYEWTPRGEDEWWRFSWRPAISPVLLVAALTWVLWRLGGSDSAATPWFGLLYVLPVLWAAYRMGLPGGTFMGSVVGLMYLAVAPASLDNQGGGIHPLVMAQQAAMLFFPILGALRGAARDRELELSERLRRGLNDVVRALRSALNAKDSYTEGHVARVAYYALAVGRRLGMDPRQLELLEVASLMHDVGKIGIPEEILHKPGPLDAEEQAIMQRHPEIGARIIEELEGWKEAAPLVRHHQERLDGRRDGPFAGYPDGLKGDQIPLGARIIAVVDAFDALTSDRSYRRAAPPEQAVSVLLEEQGTQFDPRVVSAFLKILEEKPWSGSRIDQAAS